MDRLAGVNARVNREASVFVSGGRAALLQLAHPFVASGVLQHSALGQSVQARFYRTFFYVFRILYGDAGQLRCAAEQVRKLHDSVQGTLGETVGPYHADDRYSAHDQGAVFWVFSTLVESAVFAYDLMVQPSASLFSPSVCGLSSDEKDNMLKGSVVFARCFGIRPQLIPPSWDAFMRYNHSMWHSAALARGQKQQVTPCHSVPSQRTGQPAQPGLSEQANQPDLTAAGHARPPQQRPTLASKQAATSMQGRGLAVGENARTLKHFLLKSPHWIYAPALRWVELVVAVLLPSPVRTSYGWVVSRWQRLLVIGTLGFLRLVYSCLPPSFRYLSKYQDMERRRHVFPARRRWPGRMANSMATYFLALFIPPRATIPIPGPSM